MSLLTGSDAHHPLQPLLLIPEGQGCGSGNRLETMTVFQIFYFNVKNELRFCILHINVSLFYYVKIIM